MEHHLFNGSIKGKYFYLYLFMDLFSRKIIGWEVWDSETSERRVGENNRKRKVVYEKAKQKHSERWSGEIRSWDYSDTKWLNPRQKNRRNNGDEGLIKKRKWK